MCFANIFAKNNVEKLARIPEARIVERIIKRIFGERGVSCPMKTAEPVLALFIAYNVTNERDIIIVFMLPIKNKKSFFSIFLKIS